MGAQTYADLIRHEDHKIVVTTYGLDGHEPVNVAVECEDCGEVLLDFDREEDRQLPDNALTLSPALVGRWREQFPRWDDSRDLLVFPEGAPHLTDDWTHHRALDVNGDEAWIKVRRAACGLGCRCAGEYRPHWPKGE